MRRDQSPYYWQRDYGVSGQSGQEDTIEEYVRNLTKVFPQARRTLKNTGVMFLVLGDTYYPGRGQPKCGDPKQTWRSVAREAYRAVDRPGMGLPRKSLIATDSRGDDVLIAAWLPDDEAVRGTLRVEGSQTRIRVSR